MGELDELLAKSEIKFPEPINRRSFQGLLYIISQKLGSDIEYTLESRQSIRQRDTNPDSPLHTYDSFKYSGAIISRKNFALSSFNTESRLSSLEKISAIKFQTIPGYSLSEHRPEEVEIWDKTRKVVQDYFTGKKD